MADLDPNFENSTATGDGSGTLGNVAWPKLSRILGQVNGAESRPNTARILYVDEDDTSGVDGAFALIDAATVPAGDRVIIELGPGHFDASKFAFVGQTDVIVRGQGKATVIDVSANTTAGAPASDTGYPNSLRFSGNVRCGLENMRVEFTDSASGASITQGAIARRNNNNSTDCWFRDIEIVVGEMDSTRTGAGSQVYGIDLVSSTNGDYYGILFDRVDIISSNSGIKLGAGELHFHDCNIWIGDTARTGGPHAYGVKWDFNCRWYWWNGKITTGYGTTNPNSTRGVYCVYGAASGTDGVGWIWNSVMFARNEGAGGSRAVYMVGTTTSPWLRVSGSYLQAEDTSTDVEAVETDWVPSEGSTDGNIVQLDNNIRIAGINGNAIGKDGRIAFSGDISIPSSFQGNWIASGLSADATATLHSNEPVNNDVIVVKNADTTYDVIVTTDATASDQLDGTTDGSVTVPPGGMIKIISRTLSGSDILYETMESNFHVITETKMIGVGGEVIDSQVIPRGFTQVAANETLELVDVRHIIASGTSVSLDIQKNGTSITGLSAVSVTTTESTTAPTSAESFADGDDYRIVPSSASGTPANLSVALEFQRTVITKGA